MPKYNLVDLGHEEFERLCQSLVQQIIGPGAKVYGMGSDGSREATFQGRAPYPSTEEQWDGGWIFQAKFHDVQQIGPKEARRRLLAELEDELLKITRKYRHPCDIFILMTNVSLTPVFQKGIKDKIDNEIIPKYANVVKHIHVWGAEEICRFLDAYPNIRRAYAHLLVSGDIIARLLGLVEREETELDELVKLYCQGCFTHEQYAVLDDAGDVEDKPVELHRVFIDLDASPPVLPKDAQVLERLPKWLKQASEDEKRTSALSYLLDDFIPGLVLIGGPGEGKSTLGQYVAQIHRGRLIGKLNELGEKVEEVEKCIPRVSFSILLREYAQWVSSRNDSDGLFHYLAIQVSRESGRDASPEDIQKIVKANPVLLILDGLDEVSEKRLRRRVLNNITSFANQVRNVLKGDLRVIATTRPYGYSEEFDPTHYFHLTLQKLSSGKVVLYARRWTAAREPRFKEAERILNTLGVCLKDKVVSVLTQTPLQVTILLVIIRARGTPPKQREELFERYMDIVYQREQKNRPELLRTEQHIIYGLHKYLAYILHRRAEKDRTAALMDVSEFRKEVEEYLVHCNPLLKEKELKVKVGQIIKEASQRLVLIESPQQGKVGFGLTTMREFFAAAHLVDTAKDTKERDLRFKAIAMSPHWRNVALFFAGRVGRTRPGEAPSMVDVCREIDTEKVDRFLKRGTELVVEMVDDRVLREPHNEIGALQYGLTLLDRGFIRDSERFISRLKSLPEQYKGRVIRPWVKNRLKNVSPENLEVYADIYQGLFGFGEPLQVAIQRASEFDSKEAKLWALSKAIENRVVQTWVIKLLEELVDIVPTQKLSSILGDHWRNLRLYLIFSLSPKARVTIAYALLAGIRRYVIPRLRPKPSDEISEVSNELSKIKPDGKPMENFLYLWAVCQLPIIHFRSMIIKEYRERDWPVEFRLPCIADPNLKAMMIKNTNFIRDFCETFSKENSPLSKFLVALFEFLLDPHNSKKCMNILEKLQGTEKHIEWLIATVSSILGSYTFRSESEEKLYEYLKDLFTLCEYYNSEKQYVKDTEELNKLINKESRHIINHPHRFLVWVNSNCDRAIEKFLDTDILSKMKVWLQDRGLSEKALCFCPWTMKVISNFELFELILETIERQLTAEQKRIGVEPPLVFYRWHKPRTEQELISANRLKSIFEEVLANYSSIIDLEHRRLEDLYWSALNAGILEEKHMAELFKILHNDPKFPHRLWFVYEARDAQSALVDMLRSDNMEVVSLATVSLVMMPQSRLDSNERERIQEKWIGEKFWELAKDTKAIWRSKYIRGMACCKLEWVEKYKNWFEAIQEANTEELQDAWCEVIKKAGYYKDKDRDAFFDLLFRILESENALSKPIRLAASQRLYEMVSEIEPIGFNEKILNLPLSRRAGIHL